MKKTLLAFAMVLSTTAAAENYTMDARVQGIAGAGTAAATFLSAGFYNPALVAINDQHKRVGVLFPIIGVQYRDPDELLDKIDNFKDAFSNYQQNPTNAANQDNAKQTLSSLSNIQAVITGGLGGSAGIPTKTVSGVFFVKAFSEGRVITQIDPTDANNIDSGNTTLNSKANVLGISVIDFGLALGGSIDILRETIAIGITPKVQQLYSYNYEISVTNFDFDNWSDAIHRTEDNVMNFDIGFAWQRESFRLGFAGKNLLDNKIKTVERTRVYEYNLNPLYTLGIAWVDEQIFTIALDLDLNKQERFLNDANNLINDDSQFVRIGSEVNFSDTLQLRAGFIRDLEENYDDTVSIGIGFGIDEIARLDVVAEFIGSSSYGGAIQLSFGI